MRTFLLALLFAPLAASASPLPDFPFVYVYGTAHREVAPDKVTITFQVKSYDVQAERAYRKQSEIADTVIGFATKLGVANDDLIAQAIEKSAVRREDEKGHELEIIGYDATRSVRIQLKELARFPELIEFLYSQPNVEQISATFGSKDETAILQSLTEDACRTAKANAERLSKGFEKKLGGIRAISETGFSGIGGPFGLPGEAGFVGAAGIDSKRDFRIIPTFISFHKAVYAIFAVE
jgi:uncharacterized protein YggE